MRTTLLLSWPISSVIIFIFLSLFCGQVQAHVSCQQVSQIVPTQQGTHPPHPIFQSVWKLFALLPELQVFGGTARGRRKERHHLQSDLQPLQEKIQQILNKHPQLTETVELWKDFMDYWQVKAVEFSTLPTDQQQKLRPSLEVPLSIALKHFVSFLEAPHYRRWDIERLFYLLTLHKKNPEVDLQTALFLINRGAMKFYSQWDFVHCRY